MNINKEEKVEKAENGEIIWESPLNPGFGPNPLQNTSTNG